MFFVKQIYRIRKYSLSYILVWYITLLQYRYDKIRISLLSGWPGLYDPMCYDVDTASLLEFVDTANTTIICFIRMQRSAHVNQASS